MMIDIGPLFFICASAADGATRSSIAMAAVKQRDVSDFMSQNSWSAMAYRRNPWRRKVVGKWDSRDYWDSWNQWDSCQRHGATPCGGRISPCVPPASDIASLKWNSHRQSQAARGTGNHAQIRQSRADRIIVELVEHVADLQRVIEFAGNQPIEPQIGDRIRRQS